MSKIDAVADSPARPPGWSKEESPFHEGERAIQERLGVAGKMDKAGRTGIRDFMPEQHREFFAQLPFVIIGALDEVGQVWASVLAKPPGFASSPDAQHLSVQAMPEESDPLHRSIRDGCAIGMLGIQPHTRRRNRMNGIVESTSEQSFVVKVQQSFGNCPKYINARRPEYVMSNAALATPVFGFDARARAIVSGADTFYIASSYRGRSQAEGYAAQGVDVSHRGGPPGFVRISETADIWVPDYVGNFFFNTLGNLLLQPKAGLLFMDFETGDLLYIAARAQIVWEGEDLERFPGAQRLLRFAVEQSIRIPSGLPLRWGEVEPSPHLPRGR